MFPITGLDMTPFLAPRSSTQSRPSSATPSYKTQRSTTKSVHFEDENGRQQKSPLGRSVSAGKGKGKRFLFPRRKQQTTPPEKKGERKTGKSDSVKKSPQHSRSASMEGERRRSRSPDAPRTSCSPPVGSESPMSVRSVPSNIERFQLKPHHRYFLPPSPLDHTPSSLDDTRLSNMYDLFAVCNHSGTLSRGHYTAFCRNPTDGRWYSYDDSTVQPIPEDHLITSGAYMLFYVRQSLLSSSPLSSSESSQSSCNSANHWINHMPPFKLDLNDYHEELCQLQRQSKQFSQQGYDGHTEFQARGGEGRSGARLDSSNSVLSAPPNVGLQVSPPASAQDVDTVASPGSGSVVHPHYYPQDSRSDTFSAVSLPPYRPNRGGLTTSLHHASNTPYNHVYPNTGRSMTDRVAGTRPQSMRLRRERGSGGWGTHTPQTGYPTQQRSHEDLHEASYNSQLQGHVAPTRSIPSLPTSSELAQTPNRYSQEAPRSFNSQNLRHQHQPTARSNGHIPINIGSHFKSPSLARRAAPQPESCV